MAKSNLEGACETIRAEIAAAEKITRAKMPEAVNLHMQLVLTTGDVRPINALIEVLSPMNKRAAILFYQHFLPFVSEKDKDKNHVKFGKMLDREKDKNKRIAMCEEWLREDSNFWTWTDDNIQTKVPNYLQNFTRSLATALKGNKEGEGKVDPVDLVMAFMAQVKADTIEKVISTQLNADKALADLKKHEEPEQQAA